MMQRCRSSLSKGTVGTLFSLNPEALETSQGRHRGCMDEWWCLEEGSGPASAAEFGEGLRLSAEMTRWPGRRTGASDPQQWGGSVHAQAGVT